MLLVAGLSVAIIPALRPSLIDGTAVAVPIPGVPAVGDCVTEPIPYSSLFIGLHNATTDIVVYPSLTTEPCDGPRYGEVVAVIPVPAVTSVEVNGGIRSTSDVNQDRCWKASASYLGVNTGKGTPDAQWLPIMSMPSLVSQASPRQQAQGQSWLACLTYTQSSDSIDQETTLAPYTGTLRNAVTTGNQTDQLGYCADEAPISGVEGGSCGRPHRYQQLAIAPSGEHGVRSSTLTKTCTDTANTLAGRDVITSGDLKAVVTATDNYGSSLPVTDDLPPDTSLQCGVSTAGTRLLAGSIIGLGDQPLPWS